MYGEDWNEYCNRQEREAAEAEYDKYDKEYDKEEFRLGKEDND